MSLFSARTLKFLWASVSVICGSWNLQSWNLYERSASALRRTRPTASLHPLSHLRILAKSYLTVSASSVPVDDDDARSTWVLILNLKTSALAGYAPTLLRLFTTIILSSLLSSQSHCLYCMGTKRFCFYQRYTGA